jgi:hypothetical protein
VRRRVQREDGDEYLFEFYTVVISADGVSEKELASCAASTYTKDGSLSAQAERLVSRLESIGIDTAYKLARAEIQREVEFWDWDEDVDLIGVAKVAFLPAPHASS